MLNQANRDLPTRVCMYEIFSRISSSLQLGISWADEEPILFINSTFD